MRATRINKLSKKGCNPFHRLPTVATADQRHVNSVARKITILRNFQIYFHLRLKRLIILYSNLHFYYCAYATTIFMLIISSFSFLLKVSSESIEMFNCNKKKVIMIGLCRQSLQKYFTVFIHISLIFGPLFLTRFYSIFYPFLNFYAHFLHSKADVVYRAKNYDEYTWVCNIFEQIASF